jgi:hypothetical protein
MPSPTRSLCVVGLDRFAWSLSAEPLVVRRRYLIEVPSVEAVVYAHISVRI